MKAKAKAKAKTKAKAKARGTARTGQPRKSASKPSPASSRAGKKARPGAAGSKRARATARAGKGDTATGVRLLSGGNPQIAMGDGDAPVQAYIAAMPGWKSAFGKRLDRLIVRNVPNVRKAVKWNSPLYGVAGQGWFLGVHVFTKYVKLAFFRGSALRPLPPGPSKDKHTRYLDVHEDDELDEAQLGSWLKQAAAIPGWFSNREG